MESTSKEDRARRHRRKKRKVTVSKPDEDGMSVRQMVVLGLVALFIIAALVFILSSFEAPVLRRR